MLGPRERSPDSRTSLRAAQRHPAGPHLRLLSPSRLPPDFLLRRVAVHSGPRGARPRATPDLCHGAPPGRSEARPGLALECVRHEAPPPEGSARSPGRPVEGATGVPRPVCGYPRDLGREPILEPSSDGAPHDGHAPELAVAGHSEGEEPAHWRRVVPVVVLDVRPGLSERHRDDLESHSSHGCTFSFHLPSPSPSPSSPAVRPTPRRPAVPKEGSRMANVTPRNAPRGLSSR